MKILNKNKIIVSALGLAIGASLAGSISGTVAWYQYSTRANVSFIGKAGGISGNLQMRFVGEGNDKWRTKITADEINTNLTNNEYATNIVPMTYGALGKDDNISAGYVQPAYGVANMTKWGQAKKANYAQFELELRYNERDGEDDPTTGVDAMNVAKDVYLSKLLIQEDYTNHAGTNDKKDLSEAVRVHFHTYTSIDEANTKKDRLVSKNGGTILTGGYLDLDGDGNDDKVYSGTDEGAEFGFGENTTEDFITYGGGVQTSYSNKSAIADGTYVDENGDEQQEQVLPAITGQDGNKLTDLTYNPGSGNISKSIGKVVEGDTAYLRVRVTIWVEGWQKLSNHAATPKYSAIWDANQYINSKFDIGIQFAVQDTYAE